MAAQRQACSQADSPGLSGARGAVLSPGVVTDLSVQLSGYVSWIF